MKKADGEEYEYWSLVESVRTIRGPRQRIVATIGKLPGLDKEERIGWEEIGRILSGKPHKEGGLFEQPEGRKDKEAAILNRFIAALASTVGILCVAIVLASVHWSA